MGMDYFYSGSASYPRFDRELCAVAEVFGGVKTEHLREREATENERPCGYWFGFLSSDDPGTEKFVFPAGTNETLVRWFNNIYGDFTAEETKTVWEQISKHPEIKEISYQIWEELEMCNAYDDNWHIW
ncbi:MAG: hypothetical protein J6S14_15500 [Clostridia bacterium]|nr:hypothetical protein [Clostridia bacterium]